MQPRVFVTAQLPGDWRDHLAGVAEVEVWDADQPPTAEQLRERMRGASGLILTINERVDEELLAAAPELRVVANMGVGYDNVDVPACSPRGVAVANTPGAVTEATADVAFALILTVARRVGEATAAVQQGAWGRWHPTWLCGFDLAGKTLGIVGLGNIGKAVARRGEAFGMRVIHANRTSGLPLDEVLASADVVSLHCPLTPETRGLISKNQLRRMKRSAVLINTSRGAVVDQAALAEALRGGTIAAAGLDVTVPEPLPSDHELVRLSNCVIFPHIGSATIETRSRMADMCASAVAAVLKGERPTNLVNL
ncbi:MAG TPA: D-glycerate dehydrogenase [Chloroflexota bacterium]|nr:D-glycerate dehydrogenase [Chloroflexota bacterium]